MEINFADALKQSCSAAFGIPMRYFTDPDLKELPLTEFGYPHETPRRILQFTGTELFRSRWDNIWINTWRLTAMKYPRVVVSDMRFPNELAAVKALGGTAIRVIRPTMLPSGDLHESERHAMTMEVDTTLVNSGTPAELARSAVKFVGGQMNLL